MNIFDESLAKGEISTEHDLKVLFWTLAKKLHPDTSAAETAEKLFIQLKRDFDEALLKINCARRDEGRIEAERPDLEKCRALFSELIASNFPMAKKSGNKKYVARIAELNRQINLFGYKDLFLQSEKELLEIRGNTVVSNHIFNLVRLYFYNMSDYFATGNYFSKMYVKNSRALVLASLEERQALQTVRLIDWLMNDLTQ
jgi:hypothetical protein